MGLGRRKPVLIGTRYSERLLPDVPDLTEDGISDWWESHVHVWRYLYVCKLKQLGRVADAACGYGWGTDLLVRSGHDAYGFDKSQEALKTAGEYPSLADRTQWMDLDDDAKFDGFDTLVSFETLEHLKRPDIFLRRLAPSVTQVFCSVPVIPTTANNPFHVHDFSIDTFGGLIWDAGFEPHETSLQSSPLKRNIYSVIWAKRR